MQQPLGGSWASSELIIVNFSYKSVTVLTHGTTRACDGVTELEVTAASTSSNTRGPSDGMSIQLAETRNC